MQQFIGTLPQRVPFLIQQSKGGGIVASVQKLINKVSKALNAKGIMPLINHDQFYGDNGPITKYVIHYGNANARMKNNDIVATVFNKVDLLNTLVEILKAGDSSE